MAKKNKLHFLTSPFVLSLFSFFFFSLCALYITYPLIFHLTNYASGEYVVAWIFNWNIHAILTNNIAHIFEANIYYPFHHSLAFSDTLFTSSVIALPFYLLFKQPMVPSNITFLTSIALLGFCTYLLSYYLTKNFLVSLLSGLLVIFSPVTIDRRFHLQMLAVFWVPLAVLFFLKFCNKGKLKWLLLSLLCFVLQTYNNFLIGYFLLFYYAILGGAFLFTQKEIRKKLLQKKVIFAFTVAFFTIIPICIPYFQVSKEFHYVREIRDTIHFAIQPEDLLVTDGVSRLNPLVQYFADSKNYSPSAEIQPGFFGLAFLVLTIVALVYIVRSKKRNPLFVAFVTIALLGLILSFGPALHWARKTIHHPFLIPLPYALFYYLAPGFQGFRNSARFEVLFIMTMPFAIALMLYEVLKKQRAFVKATFYVLLFAIVIGEFHFPLAFEKAKTFEEFPPVYSWIAHNTKLTDVILEVPMYNWDNNPFGNNQEVVREYYSTLHFRRIVGGGSGFSPPPWQLLAIQMYNEFPSQETFGIVKKLGVKYIVVHKGEYDFLNTTHWVSRGIGVPDGQYVLDFLDKNSSVRSITHFGDDYVYKVQ